MGKFVPVIEIPCSCIQIFACTLRTLVRDSILAVAPIPDFMACVQECQGTSVSLCLSCYYGDCVCKQKEERFDATTGKWIMGR